MGQTPAEVLNPDMGPQPRHRAGLEEVQKRWFRVLEPSPVDSLKELGLFTLEEGRLQGDLPEVFQYLRGDYKQEDKLLK